MLHVRLPAIIAVAQGWHDWSAASFICAQNSGQLICLLGISLVQGQLVRGTAPSCSWSELICLLASGLRLCSGSGMFLLRSVSRTCAFASAGGCRAVCSPACVGFIVQLLHAGSAMCVFVYNTICGRLRPACLLAPAHSLCLIVMMQGWSVCCSYWQRSVLLPLFLQFPLCCLLICFPSAAIIHCMQGRLLWCQYIHAHLNTACYVASLVSRWLRCAGQICCCLLVLLLVWVSLILQVLRVRFGWLVLMLCALALHACFVVGGAWLPGPGATHPFS
jgi:hypothetical protein